MYETCAKITIVTVCYNAASLIEKTIISVLGQTYPNVEYILIDGASKDNTMKIVDNYARQISKIVSEKDSGIYDAMNKGIALATGDWVLFMNAGDVFYDKHIITNIFEGKEYDTDVIFGDTLNHYSWGYVLAEGHVFNGKERRLPFCHQSTFVRRSVLEANLFDLSFKVSADHNQFYTLYINNYKFLHVPEIVAIFDTTGVSGYTIRGFKDVARINQYKKITYFKNLIRAYIRVSLSKVIPSRILDRYRYTKYQKYGKIFTMPVHKTKN